MTELTSTRFRCECCNYDATDMKALNRHQKTDKHIRNSGGTPLVKVDPKQVAMESRITELTELMSNMMKIIPTIGVPVAKQKTVAVPAIIKKQRTLDTFLNEHCKDAIDLKLFIDKITVNFDNFRIVCSGFIVGISNIIINELLKYNINSRPIHCSNNSKQTIHIKQDGVWIEDVNLVIIKKHIQIVIKKVQDLIPAYQRSIPVNISDSAYIDFPNMLIEVLGGKWSRERNQDTMIKNIISSVIVDARNF